ncbi:hypothetical protein TNCV_4600671 [Trichonephila clavipes]|nr:hypothetical protein TNCV_4600671 [Trichonephila clavipes]
MLGGISSEIQPLRHLRSEIVDPLGFPSMIQRCDSRKVTDLDCKLDVPGLPTFYRPVPRHTPWRHTALHCRVNGDIC